MLWSAPFGDYKNVDDVRVDFVFVFGQDDDSDEDDEDESSEEDDLADLGR